MSRRVARWLCAAVRNNISEKAFTGRWLVFTCCRPVAVYIWHVLTNTLKIHGFLTIITPNQRYKYVFKRYLIITVTLLTLVSLGSHAQYDVSFSHYFDMEPSFNAAAVGKQSKLNVAAACALDMSGFKHNPQTMYAGADMPFIFAKSYHGAGIQFLNDKIGLFTHQRLALQYAFKARLFGGQLSAGISIGLLSESFDGTKLDLDDSSDPAFSSSKLDGNALDIGVGLYYVHGPWYVGLSAQHLNSPLVNLGERNELKVDATFYATGGCDIRLRNPYLAVKPSFLVRTDGVAWRGDIGGRLVYTNGKKMMYAGASYSPANSVTVLVGGNVHGIVLGYSYEMYESVRVL